jgi:histidinol-phosphate aminotransferase
MTHADKTPDLSVIRDDVRAMRAYHVADATGLVKLDAMENPYRLPAPLAQQLGARLADVALNRYPPADPAALKAKLARAAGLPAGFGLMLGNGSDELIHLAIEACARSRTTTILAPWPGFVMYELSAQFNNCRFVGVPLQSDLSLDAAAMLQAIAAHRPAIVFVAHPNNPTGNLFDRAAIRAVIEAAAPGLVVVDEAYLPFAQDTWLPDLPAHPNLLVLRTLSKLGLAGLRLGYLCAHPSWIAELEKVRPPYNVNVLTLAAVDFLLDHLDALDAQAAQIRAERTRVLRAARAIAGVTVFDSAANFLLMRVGDADRVFAALKQHGILVKNVSRMHPLLTGCLRTTIGTADENQRFLAALAASIGEQR